MTLFHLAQVNVGRIVAPLSSPELADFVALTAEINALAERSPGFVWRMVDSGGDDATGLRPDKGDDLLLINCSVWESVEALWQFTYHTGDHLRALGRRRDWFQRLGEAHLALWWIPAGHVPTVAEAMDRVTHLRTHGSGRHAFTFRDPHPAPTGSADIQAHA